MKKISIIIVLLLLFFINNNNCIAESFYVGEYIDDAYIKKELDDLEHHLHSQFIYKDSDDEFVYCIDPFDFVNTDDEYDEHESKFLRFSGLDEEQWAYIVAAAHLGYMAGDHTDPIWYSVTQVVIWQIALPEADIYFTAGLNGRRVHDYDDMIEELYKLIIEYYDISEVPDNIFLNYNEKQEFDLNDIYKLDNPDDTAYIKSGELRVVGNEKGTKEYVLYKGDEDYVVLYTHDDAQNLIWIYDKPYVEKNIYVSTFAGNINVNLNFENEYSFICEDNTKTMYGLYDENNRLITEITSTITTNDLAYGNYYVKQIINGCGYIKDDNIYKVTLDQDLVRINIDVKQKHKTLHINHNICNDDNCSPEKDVTFLFEVNNIKKEYKTDDLGNITINTGDLVYLINQIDGDNNYTYSNNIKVDISSYNLDDIYITLNGYRKEANIEVEVVDNNDNNIEGAKICLYDDNNNLIECKYSNKGKVLFEHVLYGKYKVIEEDINDIYILNNEVKDIDVFDDILLKIVNQKKEEIKYQNEVGNTGKIIEYKDNKIPNDIIINPETGDTNIGLFISLISIASIILKKLIKNN